MPTHQNVKPRLVDRPEVSETFGDAVRGVWFDGTAWRIDLDVVRLDNRAHESDPLTSTQYPSCRLVVSLAAGLALLQRLTELANELEANGTIKRQPAPPASTVTH